MILYGVETPSFTSQKIQVSFYRTFLYPFFREIHLITHRFEDSDDLTPKISMRWTMRDTRNLRRWGSKTLLGSSVSCFRTTVISQRWIAPFVKSRSVHSKANHDESERARGGKEKSDNSINTNPMLCSERRKLRCRWKGIWIQFHVLSKYRWYVIRSAETALKKLATATHSSKALN